MNRSMTMLDNLVDQWHRGASNVPLHVYLGMRRAVYGRWVLQRPVASRNVREGIYSGKHRGKHSRDRGHGQYLAGPRSHVAKKRYLAANQSDHGVAE